MGSFCATASERLIYLPTDTVQVKGNHCQAVMAFTGSLWLSQKRAKPVSFAFGETCSLLKTVLNEKGLCANVFHLLLLY